MFYGKTPEPHGVEITNPGQSREEIIRLFQTCEAFYTYEDTALIMEALLCGCPVVCVPSESYPEMCMADEFSAGIAWGIDGLNAAKESVHEFRQQYACMKEVFKDQLKMFIQETKELFDEVPRPNPV